MNMLKETAKPAPLAPPAANSEDSPLPFPLKLGMAVLMFFLSITILALTPFTHNLDDIKVYIFMTGGPLLMLGAMALIHFGYANLPTRAVGLGLAAYFGVMIISMLLAEFNWSAPHELYFIWSAMGFFMMALCIGNHARGRELFVRYLFLNLLITNAIGWFLFTPTSAPVNNSAISWVFNKVYPTRPPDAGPLYNLLITFSRSDHTMQSTILNRDFYAGFCVMYLPFALLTALNPGRARYGNFWRVLALICTVVTLTCIFFCKSKGEYLVAAGTLPLYLLIFMKVGHVPNLQRRHLVAAVGGTVLLLVVLAWMQAPVLMERLKTLDTSIDSRKIIWAGSWGIFKEFPIFGGGPGSFDTYFPRFRRPDYFMHEIANVTVFSHNYFLDLLCETGFLGFASYCIMLGGLLIPAARWTFLHPDVRVRETILTAAMGIVAMFGSNLSSPSGRWVIGASSLWTIMGLLGGVLIYARRTAIPAAPLPAAAEKRPLHPAPSPLRWVPVAVGALGVVMLVLCFNRGRNYFSAAKDYATGISMMDPVYDAIERNLNINLQIAIEQLDSGGPDRPGAAIYLQKALATNPTNVSGFYKLASVWTTITQMKRRQAATYMQNKQPDLAQKANDLAEAYLKKAKETYEKLASMMPDYAEINYNLGIVYQDYASQLERQSESITDPEAKLAKLAEATQYDELALTHLKRMRTQSEKNEVASLLSQQYMTMGRLDEALQVLKEASDRHPEDVAMAQAYLRAASFASSDGERALALERLWKIEPDDPSHLNTLLGLCLRANLDDVLQRSVERLRSINPIDPRLFEIELRRAVAQNQPAEALSAIEKYNKSGGTRPEVYQLAIAPVRALGEEAKAVQLERFATQNPVTPAPATPPG